MIDLSPYLQDLFVRLVEAQERIAAADERRNRLLEQDHIERREYIEQQRADEAARWAALVAPEEVQHGESPAPPAGTPRDETMEGGTV